MTADISGSPPDDLDRRLEASQDDPFWLPQGVRVVARPEVRYTVGPPDRPVLNQLTRLRDNGDIDAVLDEASQAHRGRTARWVLGAPSLLPGLPSKLEARGFQHEHTHTARSLATDTPIQHNSSTLSATQITTAEDLADAMHVMSAAFDLPPPDTHTRVPIELPPLLLKAPRVLRVLVRDAVTGQPLCTGGVNLFPSLQLGFLWGGGTVPDGRGRGAYRTLLHTRLQLARQAGIPTVAVYTRHGTSDPIVDRLGFRAHGPMHTWIRSSAAHSLT